MRWALLAVACLLAPARSDASCCGDLNAPDIRDRGGKAFEEALPLTGNLTAAEAAAFRRTATAVGKIVQASLGKNGVGACEIERDPEPANDATWNMTPFGRAPRNWSLTLDCGEQLVFVHLSPQPYILDPNEQERWKVLRQGEKVLALISAERSSMGDGGDRWDQKAYVGDIGLSPLPAPIPEWANARSVEVSRYGEVGRRPLADLLDVPAIVAVLNGQSTGTYLRPAASERPTQLSEVERHVRERAVLAQLLPIDPPHPVAVSPELITFDDPYDNLHAFVGADLGLPPSLVADFLQRASHANPFPTYLSPGPRPFSRATRWETKIPIIHLSAMGFSSDGQRAMVFVRTDYPGNHWRFALLILKNVAGTWTIEYSRAGTIC